MAEINSMDTVLKFVSTKAKSYDDLSYEPTFKSSAMFPVMCGAGISVTLSFLNYWKHKNEIQNVSCLITLRRQNGDIIKRSYFRVEQDVYSLKLLDLLAEFLDENGMFVGSCELEYHSIEDLKYPYPAVTLFYETLKGISAVHAASRVFQSTQDMDLRLMQDVDESGFDIYSNEILTPFLCFTNGPRLVKKAKILFRAFNSLGEEKTIETQFDSLKPYETVFFFPGERSDLDQFLKDKVGFCKVSYDSFGIFPRLVCGNIYKDRSYFAITHSYYDVSQREEYFPVDTDKNTRGSFRAIPMLPNMEIDVDLNFYPIYSPTEINLRSRVYDNNGDLLADLNAIKTIQSPSNNMVNLSIETIANEAEISKANISLISVECETDDDRLPTRINYGINYHKNNQIGSNINISMHHDLEFKSHKPSFKWLPVFIRNDLSNHVLIAALSNEVVDDFTADVQMELFCSSGKIQAQSIHVKNQTTVSILIEELISNTSYIPAQGEVLWCTLKSDSPFIDALFLTESTQGFVGADHSY